MAKRVERAFGYELGPLDSDFIQFGYWDSLKNGLLSGNAYTTISKDWREYEFTMHVPF